MTLAGRFVRLEPLSLEHLPGLVAVGLDPELWRLIPTQITDAAGMRRYVESALADGEAGRAIPFATIEQATGTVVGSTRFGNLEPAHRRVEIGWTWIAAPWQRSAVNTEAKLLMLTHAFEKLAMNRVELKTDALNARSRAAIARIGATEEGTLRHHMVTESGRLRDTVYFSLLRDEWPEAKRRLTARLSK